MDSVPGVGLGGAVAGGGGVGVVGRLGPGGLVGQPQFWAVVAGPADRGRGAGRRGEAHHPAGAQSPEELDRQITQIVRQAGGVIAGVGHDQDRCVALAPVSGGDQPVDDLPHLPAGHRRLVVGRAEPHRVQQRGPRRRAGLQRRDDRVGPAGDSLVLGAGLPRHVAVEPLRARVRFPPQPRGDIDRQHDPPTTCERDRQRGHRPAQPTQLDPALVDRVVQRPMPPAMLGGQTQPGQTADRPVGAQHSLGQLEQGVRTAGQAGIELVPETRESPQRLDAAHGVGHTDHHGLRLEVMFIFGETT